MSFEDGDTVRKSKQKKRKGGSVTKLKNGVSIEHKTVSEGRRAVVVDEQIKIDGKTLSKNTYLSNPNHDDRRLISLSRGKRGNRITEVRTEETDTHFDRAKDIKKHLKDQYTGSN